MTASLMSLSLWALLAVEPLPAFEADADADGVPDVVEDADRDGRVDAGESDPQRPGLWPGSSPHIPEPLSFDLVRGLGARAGELEVNVLGQGHWSDGHLGPLELAPEIEWAPIDDFAVEAEAAILGGQLVALKLAAQGTASRRLAPNRVHGWQVLTRVGDGGSGDLAVDLIGLYLGGLRLSRARRWSALLMAGAGGRWEGSAAPSSVSLIVNPSVFFDLEEWATVGVETNLRATIGASQAARVLPQIHLQLSRHLRIQAGVGVDLDSAHGLGGVAALRAIIERAPVRTKPRRESRARGR